MVITYIIFIVCRLVETYGPILINYKYIISIKWQCMNSMIIRYC